MVLSKLFSSSRSRDKENEKKYIINGYPLTISPVVPDILKHQVEFKKWNRDPQDLVGFTLAHAGSDLVNRESLEMFRKKLLEWLKNDQYFCRNFRTKFPKNLIAISVAFINFELGESCQEYKLMNNVENSGNGHFTYRKLSECIQCTYYNDMGVEFLAGITFYPAPHGKPKILKSNYALLYMANCSHIKYPLGDRHKSWGMTQGKLYGRFCSTARKHVVLTCSQDDGVPRHYEFDHVTKKYKRSLCKECCEEFFTYKWEEPEKDTPANPVVIVEESIPAAVTVTDSESSAVSLANSTESLAESFERIDVSSDVESNIDGAELID
ncbi:hypothetical protein CAEBREN_22775 [Caenorhabditis brenneri]|uniref:Uncharacterized protein n=1 Tax=Caenorhabditis brenneri TaxID=135651 RepID=G0NPE8_CAEBE|nr:hypothetical protein CAEBREN_22775 [Caenorhabditis brenneri]